MAKAKKTTTTAVKTLPLNVLTGKTYAGKNAASLMGTGFSDHRWATFDQWSKLGYSVNKGQKCQAKITLFSDERAKETGKSGYFGVARLFNFEQVHKLSDEEKAQIAERKVSFYKEQLAEMGLDISVTTKTPVIAAPALSEDMQRMIEEALAKRLA